MPHAFSSDAETSTQVTETTDPKRITRLDSSEDDSEDEEPSDFDEDSNPSRPGDDLDIDLGLDDLDDLDFLSVGHSKSVSYPSIHFGNEDDPSTNGQNSPALSRPATRAVSPVPVASPKQTRTLYIQVSSLRKRPQINGRK